MTRTFFLMLLLGMTVSFAHPQICELKGADRLEAWQLAKFDVVFSEHLEMQPTVLTWKLFYEKEEKIGEFLYSTTQHPHHNRFRPKLEGTYVLQVFGTDVTTPLATKEIVTLPHGGYLKQLATGSECVQELGFVDWTENIDEARKKALATQSPILLAYYVGCDVSAGLSQQFKNPEFLKWSDQLVCVPVILGGKQDRTGSLYEVPTGLSSVLLNSEEIFLGMHFRPEIDDYQKIIPAAIQKNKELLEKTKDRLAKINTLGEQEQIYPLMELAYFYQKGKAYTSAVALYETAFSLLQEYPENALLNNVVENLLFIHITLNSPDDVIVVAESVEAKTPYMLFALGAAYALKAETNKELFSSSAKNYFERLKQTAPNSPLIETAQKFMDKLEH